MKRTPLIRTLIAVMVFAAFMSVYQIAHVQGEENGPKYVLMRLEDVGPGGQYASMEQLGKLRAVVELLAEKHIPYSIAVISHWYDAQPDQPVYDKSIAQTDDPYVAAFDRILAYAQEHGAVLGMHGYSHQVGSVPRADGAQQSGIGNEFHVAGMPETDTAAYAQQRIGLAFDQFRQAGLSPRFWETPHYHVTASQMDVFRSFIGLLYENIPGQPDQPFTRYVNKTNVGYGAPSQGAVHVPTPFSYIPYNRDEKLILDQLDRNKRLPSFFFHPFLEFKYLQPVTDARGEPVLRDGMPEYRYPVKTKSILQKLIAGLQDRGYAFRSVLDEVPFVPAQSLPLDSHDNVRTRFGDVNGDGQTDLVSWDEATGAITVQPGSYQGPRNQAPAAPAEWLRVRKNPGDLFVLLDSTGDGRSDLWIVRQSGAVDVYASTGNSFTFTRSWRIGKLGDWGELYPLRLAGGNWVLAGSSRDRSELLGLYIRHGEPVAIPPLRWQTTPVSNLQVARGVTGGNEHAWLAADGGQELVELSFLPASRHWRVHREPLPVPIAESSEWKLGDFNGDGTPDLLVWNNADHTGTEYIASDDHIYRPVSSFGPWGRPAGKLVVHDFDGNGTSDLGWLDNVDGTLDTALSFQSRQPAG